MFRIWVSQEFGNADSFIDGYVSGACDELLDDHEDIAVGHFTLEQIAAIIPTLEYGDDGGCRVLEIRVERV